ncbi:alpha/beta hydrolase family esterase [Ramlibacter tataouinensis]|uniref:Esterase, Carbohydrate Esterase Family 1-like protein n=1 Tax=Ramlibacter tataouinensis (strain ATCC BAA-407 / DSM 14655 / LMG 21543 / TTB310) TaxID=365046 RepID=F5XVL1_RAMTT|nr:PHB depolymerase family esterase [Ramlibacter tataouinensis]AEG91587.1 esterase, Carbohydrate Esterase Family 1-like protein [Ramlibacter tataouinensis TTB310]
MRTVQALQCAAAMMAGALWVSAASAAPGDGPSARTATTIAQSGSGAAAQPKAAAKAKPAAAASKDGASKAAVRPASKPKAAPRTAAKPRAPVKRPTARTAAPAAAALAAKAAPAWSDTESRLTRPGDHPFTIAHGGLARSYRVNLPAGYHPATPAPLLVLLQGASRESARDIQDLARQAQAQGFITVFPQGAARGLDGKALVKAAWNADREPAADDVGFVMQAVANVFRQASIDRERIYAAGLGEAAAMAWRLACDKPDIFTAVVGIGAAQPAGPCSPSLPVSVLHFQAGDPLPGAAPGTRDPAAQWAQLNGCSAAPRRILDIGADYCESYGWCRGQAEVQRCVAGSDGESPAKGGALTISATDRMWDFLGRR